MKPKLSELVYQRLGNLVKWIRSCNPSNKILKCLKHKPQLGKLKRMQYSTLCPQIQQKLFYRPSGNLIQ